MNGRRKERVDGSACRTRRELLLAAAAVALGQSGCEARKPRSAARAAPLPEATGPLRFGDVTERAGIRYRWGHTSWVGLDILQTVGHGCAFLDYDGDGRLDVLLVGADRLLLFRNEGSGAFRDVSLQAFRGAQLTPGILGCAVADYDGDGRPDIFVSGYGRTILYHNEGNGTFRDVTANSGLEARGPDDWTTSAAWADVDGDGRLDLYVCRYVRFGAAGPRLCPNPGQDGKTVMMACGPRVYPPEKGSLYCNLGGGRFRDVTAESGLEGAHGNALACMFCDVQGKGRPDLYIANDQMPGDFFVNQGGGRFISQGIQDGVAFNANGSVPSGMGIDWADYTGSGRFALLVGDFANQPKSLYQNVGGFRFAQESYATGLAQATLKPLTFGAAFVDADNDGWPDIVLTNGQVWSQIDRVDRTQSYPQKPQILRNVRGRFQDVSAMAGPAFQRPIVGRGIAIGDYDGDGRLDLLMVDEEGSPILLHNESPAANSWISLSCARGAGGSPAVGARVTITAGGRTQIGEVRSSGSYLSTNAPAVHFGLGRATTVDAVVIRWPGGRSTRLRDLACNRAYTITPESGIMPAAMEASRQQIDGGAR